MTQEPAAVRDGDVASFDAFLDWIIDRGDVEAVAASPLLMIRVTWRTVNRQLQFAAHHNVVDMSPQQVIHSYVSGRGGTLRSRDTYVSRLRCGLNLYQAFLANAPDWRTARPTDVQRRVAVRQRTKTAPPAWSPSRCAQTSTSHSNCPMIYALRKQTSSRHGWPASPHADHPAPPQSQRRGAVIRRRRD